MIVAVLEGRSISSPAKAPRKSKKSKDTTEEASSGSETAPKAKRAPSEKTLAWNAEVTKVWEEMKASDPTVKRSQALAEASRRRKEAVAE